MSIYTAPSTYFIDSFMNAARYLDERTAAENKQLMEGVGNLIESGADAYKWQQQKNILNKYEELQKKIEALRAEKERLSVDYAGSSRNFDAIMNGMDGI